MAGREPAGSDPHRVGPARRRGGIAGTGLLAVRAGEPRPGYEYAGYERTIDSHIKNLRRKLGPGGSDVVETVTGVGYRLGLHRDERK
ncbi:winged helix-turn-helix domain-containing protein [Arthrobacter sp. U41]|uniref:winged helix-turn-helix domain-containing protein n=1 Tax=Arthrobacter sp. U41 TaxID=1849032 RepID=UPI003FA49DAB